MSSREGTTEQPTIPEPAPLSIEHLSLGIAVVAFTVASSGLVVEATSHHTLLRGAYAILAALMVVGFCGWCAKLVLRRLAAVAALLVEVRDMLQKGPVAPDAEAALRRIGMKLLQGGKEIG